MTQKSAATDRKLDRTDLAILDQLRRNGRLSNVALARAVNLSPSPCLERVRRLERDGYILGYAARLNPDKLGRGFIAFVSVGLERSTEEAVTRIGEEIRRIDAVTECHMVGGDHDLLLKIQVADMQAFRNFIGNELSRLPGIAQTESNFVMEVMKNSPEW